MAEWAEGWEVKSFEQLIDENIIDKIQDGNHGNDHPKSSDFVKQGIPFIMASDLSNGQITLKSCHFISKDQADSLRVGFAYPGDVLLTHKGTVGRVAIIPPINDYLMLTPQVTLYRIGDESRLSRNYLKSYFESDEFQNTLQTLAAQSTRAYIGITNQKKLTILLPPIEEQRKIAEILSTWDEAIGLTQQLIAALGRRKLALMQLLLTGEVRFAEFIHSNEQQETGFGSIPVDWQYARIDEIANSVSERNVDGRDLPVLSCTKYDGLVDSLTYFGRQIFSDDISTYKVVRRGQFAYATNHIEEGSIGYQDLYDAAVISPMYTVFDTTEHVYDAYLYAVLKTEQYRKIFEVNTSASVDRRGSLRWPQFSRIRVPLPELEEQHAIARTIETAQEIIETYGQLLSGLQEQKRGLMQQLLTGQVRVQI